MTRDDHVQLDGIVTQVFAGGQFEVKTDAGAVVRAQLSGRMRKNRIRVILGDRVIYHTPPSQRRAGGALINVPYGIEAVDLLSGNVVWSRAVRDTRYRGPLPH